MEDHIIVGVHVTNRKGQVIELQKCFSEYGCNIKTRLGLHDANESECSASGVILLEIFGGKLVAEEMIAKFKLIAGVDAQLMIFGH